MFEINSHWHDLAHWAAQDIYVDLHRQRFPHTFELLSPSKTAAEDVRIQDEGPKISIAHTYARLSWDGLENMIGLTSFERTIHLHIAPKRNGRICV